MKKTKIYKLAFGLFFILLSVYNVNAQTDTCYPRSCISSWYDPQLHEVYRVLTQIDGNTSSTGTVTGNWLRQDSATKEFNKLTGRFTSSAGNNVFIDTSSGAHLSVGNSTYGCLLVMTNTVTNRSVFKNSSGQGSVFLDTISNKKLSVPNLLYATDATSLITPTAANLLNWLVGANIGSNSSIIRRQDSATAEFNKLMVKVNWVSNQLDTMEALSVRASYGTIKNVTGATTGTQTLTTVTSGKNYYVTRIVVTGFNNNTSTTGDWKLSDGGTAFYESYWVYFTVGTTPPQQKDILTFDPPLRLSTNIVFTQVGGTPLYTYNIYGYEK